VPTLDLALGLGMQRGAMDMAHAVGVDPFGEILCDVAGAVLRGNRSTGSISDLSNSLSRRGL
jgi:hypothetical protein